MRIWKYILVHFYAVTNIFIKQQKSGDILYHVFRLFVYARFVAEIQAYAQRVSNLYRKQWAY